jgi:hypothetical protein
MNDETFVSGGTIMNLHFCSRILKMKTGINTASGIGDIVAVLDGDVTILCIK